ncbi:hypothetical protein C5884_00510 [Escherichia coli O171]|nr:hypothetical protein [Escherichia coli O171]
MILDKKSSSLIAALPAADQIIKEQVTFFPCLATSFDSQYTPRKISSQSILYTFLKYFICH